MDATDKHMARIYDRIDADGARVKLDCDHCELNAATERLKAERDAARNALALIHAEPTYDEVTGAVVSVLVTGFDGRKTLHMPERKDVSP